MTITNSFLNNRRLLALVASLLGVLLVVFSLNPGLAVVVLQLLLAIPLLMITVVISASAVLELVRTGKVDPAAATLGFEHPLTYREVVAADEPAKGQAAVTEQL